MSSPKCPNHTVSMDRTDNRRLWICPISGALFEADSDEQKTERKLDKFGNPITEWTIDQADGGTGG